MAIPTYGATVALRSSKLSSGRGGPSLAVANRRSLPFPAARDTGSGVSSAADGAVPPAARPLEAPEPRMAKRARGSTRPGQRKPITRRPATSTTSAAASTAAAAPRPAGLTDAELARAAELEAQLVAEEQAAQNARRRSQERSTAAREISATPVTAIDDAREYAYVARDLKDIARIAILLLIVLFVLYIAIDVTGVFKIHSIGAGYHRPMPTRRTPAGARPEPLFRPPPERQPLAARMRPRTSRSSSGRSTSSASAAPLRRMPSSAATSRRCCCGGRPGPARPPSPGCSPTPSTRSSRRSPR